jgi:predicted Zn-dependent protease
VTKPLKEVKEEMLTGMTTPQTIVALVCLLGFALTLDRPGHVLFAAGNAYGNAHSDLWVNSAQVLIDVDNLEPAKLLAQGNIDDAIGEASKEVNEHPTDIRTVICAGNILSQYGDKQKGFQLLRKSIDLAPQSRYVLLNYARRLAAGDRSGEAIDQYLILCKNYPKQIEPHFELANIYMNSGKPKLAAEQYKSILAMNPGYTLVKKDYALALAASGNEKEGFQGFVDACSVGKDEASYAATAKALLQSNGNSARKAIGDMRIEVATRPKRIGPRITYAQLLLYLGKEKDAKDVAVDALKVDSHNPELYMVLAEANLKLEDKDSALKAFKKAVTSLSAGRS